MEVGVHGLLCGTLRFMIWDATVSTHHKPARRNGHQFRVCLGHRLQLFLQLLLFTHPCEPLLGRPVCKLHNSLCEPFGLLGVAGPTSAASLHALGRPPPRVCKFGYAATCPGVSVRCVATQCFTRGNAASLAMPHAFVELSPCEKCAKFG